MRSSASFRRASNATSDAVIPLSAPSFRFPADDFYASLPDRFPVDIASEVSTRVQTFFKRITINFPTHASDLILDVQAMEVVKRVPRLSRREFPSTPRPTDEKHLLLLRPLMRRSKQYRPSTRRSRVPSDDEGDPLPSEAADSASPTTFGRQQEVDTIVSEAGEESSEKEEHPQETNEATAIRWAAEILRKETDEAMAAEDSQDFFVLGRQPKSARF